jgi:hypothetical protein
MKKIYFFAVLISLLAQACAPESSLLTGKNQQVPPTSTNPAVQPQPPLGTPTRLPVHSQQTETDNCIPPLTATYFPVGETISPPKQDTVPLPSEWQPVSSIPEKYLSSDSNLYLEFLANQAGRDEIWIYEFPSRTYLIYRPDQNDWEELTPIPPGPTVFLDNNGNIWSLTGSQDPNKLYRLNESQKRFEPMLGGNNVLFDMNILSIKVANDNLFWMIARPPDNTSTSLFSFDPETLETKQALKGSSYENLEPGPSGELYLMEGRDTLTKYVPKTGKTYSILLPSDFEAYGDPASMYIDHHNRLWISDRVWVDISNQDFSHWNIVVRSPIFIDYLETFLRFSWTRPTVQLESSNGILWYSSTRGSAWFDPASGNWCLFTSYSGNIVEDSEHNLWMLIGNTLYKYRVEQ